MITLDIQVRRAGPEDHRPIANLILNEANTHRHLDWRSALEWIGARNYWVLERQGRIMAVLACPEDPHPVAWIRVFSFRQPLHGSEVWPALWEIAMREIFASNREVQVAAIVTKQWFQDLLLASGFDIRQSIVLLNLNLDSAQQSSVNPTLHIRRMHETDLPSVAELDLAAFGGLWHNSLDSIRRAFLQALYATVVEDGARIAGFQISTGNRFGSHLARLGVHPTFQGRGYGLSLVNDLINYLTLNQIVKLSVNTQSDNDASLALYHKLGFVRTGENFPVLVYRAGSS